MIRRRSSSNESSPDSPSSYARRSTGSSAATALNCRSFRQPDRLKRGRYASDEKMFERFGTDFEEDALCNSDSDLLPPRSRYPIKRARNRQPSPPPVALPGPLLSGAPLPFPLTGPRGGPPAS